MMPYLLVPVTLFNGGSEEQKATCNTCKGTAIHQGIDCNTCNGFGYVMEPATEPESKQVQLRLNPQCIESFYPCFYEGASMIIMMSGKEYMTPCSCQDLEIGIANYWRQINEKLGPQHPPEGRIVTLNPSN